MIIIKEIINVNESQYLKKYISEKKDDTYEEKINIFKVTLIDKSYPYIFLYDNNMNVIREAYKFLNINLRNLAYNSRDSIANSLKLLYLFMNIFKVSIDKLDINSIVKLKEFLYGRSRNGSEYVTEYISTRNASTINKYLGYYRNYLNFLDIKNDLFNNKRAIGYERGNNGLFGHIQKKTYEKFLISENVFINNINVPRYLSELEFNKILNEININYNLREELIVRLMFENGMRIGEVLGLTIEDIEEDKIKIRNRLSNNKDQFAKTCFKPKYFDDYKSPTYKTLKIGYQVIKPTISTLDKILDYIDICHGNMSKSNRNNYLKSSKADKVTDGSTLENDNYYLFLNKDGKPLRVVGWNKILRKIFNVVGITLDERKRIHNLNHRFRHGFAMKLVKDGASPVEIANALRHNGLSSVMCYFRPTEEDIYDANKFGADSMMKKILLINSKDEEV